MKSENYLAITGIGFLLLSLGSFMLSEQKYESPTSKSYVKPVHKKNTNPIVDKCLQKQYFDQCMSSLPSGPVATKYNDWDEVVYSCQSVSKNMSFRMTYLVKEECKSGYTNE